jgi:hypothetical protein
MAATAVALTAGTGALAQEQQHHNAGAAKPAAAAAQHEPQGRSSPAARSETTGQASQEHATGGENSPPKGGPVHNERSNRGESERQAAGRENSQDHNHATTGQGSAQEHTGANAESAKGASPHTERSNRGNDERRAAGGENRQNRNRTTTGQGPAQAQPGESHNDNAQIDRSRETGEHNRAITEQDRGQAGRNERAEHSETSTTGVGTSVGVTLSSEQRTRIHDVIVHERSAPRVNSVNFALHVGTAVPRSVHLAPVPSAFVEIEPVWRGFEYFLVADDIVIVNPRTMEIVAVVPA